MRNDIALWPTRMLNIAAGPPVVQNTRKNFGSSAMTHGQQSARTNAFLAWPAAAHDCAHQTEVRISPNKSAMLSAVNNPVQRQAMQVLSWNMQRGRGVDGRCDAGRALASVQQLVRLDIIFLQELASHYTDLEGLSLVDQFAQRRALLPEWTAVEGIVTDRLSATGTHQRFGNMDFFALPGAARGAARAALAS